MIPKLYQNKTYYIDIIFKKVVAILKGPRKLSLTALTDQMETGTRSGSCSSSVVIINDTMAVILALAL